MPGHPTFRKVFDRVATREEMFALFDRHRGDVGVDPLSGQPYAGEWFEIDVAEYSFMQSLLPPLFKRIGMFGISEFRSGHVTSVFFAIRIRGRVRWFHGFCDLTDKSSPDAMRAAIIAHETAAVDGMTRDEKLEAIWAATPEDYRGIAGALNPGAWPPDQRGKRTILVHAGGPGTILKLLEDLSDSEIDERLSNALEIGRRRKRTMPDPP